MLSSRRSAHSLSAAKASVWDAIHGQESKRAHHGAARALFPARKGIERSGQPRAQDEGLIPLATPVRSSTEKVVAFR
jgi:hypothetical protein